MILKRKILLLFVLAALSGPAFAQIAPPPKPPSKEQLKAEKEAQEKAEKAAKEKADAEAKAKAKQEADILKMLEKQAKGNVCRNCSCKGRGFLYFSNEPDKCKTCCMGKTECKKNICRKNG